MVDVRVPQTAPRKAPGSQICSACSANTTQTMYISLLSSVSLQLVQTRLNNRGGVAISLRTGYVYLYVCCSAWHVTASRPIVRWEMCRAHEPRPTCRLYSATVARCTGARWRVSPLRIPHTARRCISCQKPTSQQAGKNHRGAACAPHVTHLHQFTAPSWSVHRPHRLLSPLPLLLRALSEPCGPNPPPMPLLLLKLKAAARRAVRLTLRPLSPQPSTLLQTPREVRNLEKSATWTCPHSRGSGRLGGDAPRACRRAPTARNL